MSVSLRVRYQYRHFLQFIYSLSLPDWMTSSTARTFVLGAIVLLSVAYIFQMNRLSASGYVIHDLEKKVATVKRETQKLETEVATYQSMASIQQRLSDVNLVPFANVKHIQMPSDAAVARR